jgi:hypothetical protein
MAVVLNRDLTQGSQDGEWTFGVSRTRTGSSVSETIWPRLSHEVVVRIYRDAIGALPATGLELSNVLDKWDQLEPRLRAEIEGQICPD